MSRAVVLSRAGGRCECCGHPAPLDFSHRVARGMGGRGSAAALATSDAAWNAIGACRTCHRWIEEEPAAARVLGWKLPHGADPAQEPAFLRTLYGDGWFLLGAAGEYISVEDPT